MSQFDLREWLRAVGAAGELQHIRGADAVLEIGAASELNTAGPIPGRCYSTRSPGTGRAGGC